MDTVYTFPSSLALMVMVYTQSITQNLYRMNENGFTITKRYRRESYNKIIFKILILSFTRRTKNKYKRKRKMSSMFIACFAC